MRIDSKPVLIVSVLMSLVASRAGAGITVTSYSTTAATNGFAPSLQGPYLAQQTLENITPALANVAGDWTGPNADGTPATWHYVGTSQASSTTTFDANSHTVTAAGSFEYELDTTAAFIDPRPSVLTPGGAANYRGFFETDVSLLYAISAQLNPRGRVRLSSIEDGVVFDHVNVNQTPVFLNFSGTLMPGHFSFLASASLAASNLPNGVNHYAHSGSFENVIFAVQVPEPSGFGFVLSIIGINMCRRRRRGYAG